MTEDTKNTEAEATAVDEGVQKEIPKDARYHRRAARKLLIGKKGLSKKAKYRQITRAIAHLEKARDMIAEEA